MGDMSCPNCGFAQLDVDAAQSVVYCRQCGFAVKVDPQTGEATPISQGNAPGGARGGAPVQQAAPPAGGGGGFFGIDPTTSLLGGTLAIMILAFLFNMLADPLIPIVAWVLFFVYWMQHR